MTATDLAVLPPGVLPSMDVAARAGRVRAGFADAGIDALVVTRLPNVRYLTGFTGSAAIVVLTPDTVVLVTDGRYAQQARAQLDAAGVAGEAAIGATPDEQRVLLVDALAGRDRVGLEAHGVTWNQQRDFATWFEGHELVPTTDLVEAQRRIKEPAEIARIKAACAIADDALAELLPTLADGPTERDFALALEFGMRRRGATKVSFDPIVASGPNGALPHARPSDRPIGRGELVVIDFGCVIDGYCSDMTRTVSVGDPGPEATRVWETVLASQQAGRAALAPGVACAAVDGASRSVIEAAGWGDAFVHGTGHGVGLEIHETPRVARTATGTLAPGHVVTVEPGVYLPGVGGVRIEDTLVVTADGAQALTEFPKHLVC
jgi:Xaa-Pro aminopeptidase